MTSVSDQNFYNKKRLRLEPKIVIFGQGFLLILAVKRKASWRLRRLGFTSLFTKNYADKFFNLCENSQAGVARAGESCDNR